MAQNQNTSVSLGSHFTDFIAAQVHEGHYSSATEVVRAGLRLLEEHEAKVKTLRKAMIDGENSGPPVSLDNAKLLKDMKAK